MGLVFFFFFFFFFSFNLCEEHRNYDPVSEFEGSFDGD